MVGETVVLLSGAIAGMMRKKLQAVKKEAPVTARATYEAEGDRHQLTLPSGISLAYREWSPGKTPVLLLHGLGDHGLVWAEVASAWGDRYHCVAPDLRGHGESSKPPTGYRCEDIIADLEGLMDHLGWPSAHVVAHSWAAKVAAIWARQRSPRFQSLVLVDPFFIGALPGWLKVTFPLLYRVLPFLQTMGPFPSYEAAEAKIRQLKQYQGWSPLQQVVFAQAMTQKEDGTWGSKFVAQARDEVFEDVMQVAGLTEPLAVPTLFVQPEQGLNRRDWQFKPYRTYLSDLTWAVVPGNHWAFLVEPEPFAEAVGGFLAAH